jgi:endonuclease/exonuclease/phosphatase family metal-dependent hydrolase
LFQEVDLDATRSFHINQYSLIRNDYPEFDSVKSISYDSSYIFYPLSDPHGKSLSSIATFSKFDIKSSLRRSLPIATDYTKFFDLDRCYSIIGIPVDNGKTLYIYNVHLSAYGGSPAIRDGQIAMLMEDLKKNADNGDYVICGGDFNHDFTGDSMAQLNEGDFDFGWAQPFPAEKLPDGIFLCKDYTHEELIPTTRNTDIPYEKGVSFVVVIDGFLVSSNIEPTQLVNVDNGFKFTDHNPVQMKFILKQ